MTKAELIDDCLFCKIIRSEIPSYTVFENDDVKAFLDISQVNEGHVLMVPKKHLTTSLTTALKTPAALCNTCPEMAKAHQGF